MEGLELDFYYIDKAYTDYLQAAETAKRGFTRVPNNDYQPPFKRKFFFGVVLVVNNVKYFVPVSSNTKKTPANIIIRDKHGSPISSLRFNFMFPVPDCCLHKLVIANETDEEYKNLLNIEYSFCTNQKNIPLIFEKAKKVYEDIIEGKNQWGIDKSCDFKFLEQKALEYISKEKSSPEKDEPEVEEDEKEFDDIN